MGGRQGDDRAVQDVTAPAALSAPAPTGRQAAVPHPSTVARPSRSGTGAGTVLLAGAALLFGSTFLVMQDAIEQAEPTPFLGMRFLIAAAILAPFARRRPAAPGEVRIGLLAGGCLVAGYLFQTFGLRTTPSSTSAFITYLLVVIVPVFVAVSERRWPNRRVAVGVVVAVAGLVLLSGAGGAGLGTGELLTLASAFGFAAHLIVVGRGAARLDPVRFTFIQVLAVGVVCAVPGAGLGGYDVPASVWGAAAFTGVFATAVAFFCMVHGQRHVSTTRAALIMLLEPVSAGFLGVVTGEELGWTRAGGAALILVAILIVEVLPLATGEVDDDPAVEPTVHG